MNANAKLILSMVIFGTIGVFRRYLPLPSALVALARGLIGLLFLLLVMRLRKRPFSWKRIRARLPLLALSGAFLGINWILLFEAYNYTSVAVATLCYYFAPMFIILASPIALKEALTPRRLACVGAALLGMLFISGVLGAGAGGTKLKGILLGLAAAVFYACVVIANKKIQGVEAFERTAAQLGASSLVLLPYVLLTTDAGALQWTPAALALLLTLGVVHTGVAYALYFGALRDVRAQSAAILSYIDPLVAILLSALLLGEKLDALGIVGALLVLGAAVVSELPERK